MAVYHAQARLLLLATPHAGARSLAASLVALGGRASEEHHDTLAEVLGQGLLGPSALAHTTVVTSVRNHFDGGGRPSARREAIYGVGCPRPPCWGAYSTSSPGGREFAPPMLWPTRSRMRSRSAPSKAALRRSSEPCAWM